MSYCVNCGVKLAESEKVCPLCGTEVLNPNVKHGVVDYSPYPQRIEKQRERVNRGFVAVLGTVILAIPAAIALLLQIIDGFDQIWPIYVYGGIALCFCYVLLPLFFNKPNVYILLTIDGAVSALFLALVAWINGGILSWYLPFALPVAAEIFIYIGISVLISRIKKLGILPKIAIILFIFGGMSVLFEMSLAFAFYEVFALRWCWFILAVVGILGGAMFMVNSRVGWIDMLRRRLFR